MRKSKSRKRRKNRVRRRRTHRRSLQRGRSQRGGFNVGDTVQLSPAGRARGYQYRAADGVLRPVNDEWLGTVNARNIGVFQPGEGGGNYDGVSVVVTPPLYSGLGNEMPSVNVSNLVVVGGAADLLQPKRPKSAMKKGGAAAKKGGRKKGRRKTNRRRRMRRKTRRRKHIRKRKTQYGGWRVCPKKCKCRIPTGGVTESFNPCNLPTADPIPADVQV